ncbi:MAG: helix-turn-helix domain-containing protein [Phycisphaerae bacterium]|nr:helix-turn-helix domain-containing protein [Phycisphaerae bacterium]
MWLICPAVLSKLSAADLRVLVALSLHVNGQWKCWPAVATLSDLTGLPPRSVIRSLRRMEALGILSTVRGGGRKAGTLEGQSSQYTFTPNPDLAVSVSNTDRAVSVDEVYPDNPSVHTLTENAAYPDGAVSRTDQNTPKRTKRRARVQPKLPFDGSDAEPDEQRDNLTRDAVALWVDTYTEARTEAPDKPDGRTIGRLKVLIHEVARGDLAELRRRLRLAAGLDGQVPPWPFDRPGELTVDGVIRHWARLGDALKAGASQTRAAGRPDLASNARYLKIAGVSA